MAASTIPLNSSSIILELSEDSGTTFDIIGNATSASLQWSMSTRDITTKDSGGRKEVAPGVSEWSLSLEGLVTYDIVADTDKPNDLYTLADAKTEVNLKYGSLNTGEYDYRGDAFFTSYSQEAGTEDNNTFSVSFEGNGQLSQAIVS